MFFNRSVDGSKKQHKIFDLIEVGNSEDEEVMESSIDNEIEVLQSNGTVASCENNTVKFSTDEEQQGKALSKQMKHFEETENDINNGHTNNFFPPKDLISMIEDVGGKYLFSVRKTYTYFCMFITCSLPSSCFAIPFSVLLAFSLVIFPFLPTFFLCPHYFPFLFCIILPLFHPSFFLSLFLYDACALFAALRKISGSETYLLSLEWRKLHKRNLMVCIALILLLG